MTEGTSKIRVEDFLNLDSVSFAPLKSRPTEAEDEHRDAATMRVALSKPLDASDFHKIVANLPHLQNGDCKVEIAAGRAGEWDGYCRVGAFKVRPPAQEGGCATLTFPLTIEDGQPELRALLDVLLQNVDLGNGPLRMTFEQYQRPVEPGLFDGEGVGEEDGESGTAGADEAE